MDESSCLLGRMLEGGVPVVDVADTSGVLFGLSVSLIEQVIGELRSMPHCSDIPIRLGVTVGIPCSSMSFKCDDVTAWHGCISSHALLQEAGVVFNGVSEPPTHGKRCPPGGLWAWVPLVALPWMMKVPACPGLKTIPR